mgnify:CR=1 FL=1
MKISIIELYHVQVPLKHTFWPTWIPGYPQTHNGFTLIKLVTDDVADGIRTRYERAAATYKHKDESVEQGREFVEAYVAFTHYVERIHLDAAGKAAHDEHSKGSKPSAAKHRSDVHKHGH